MKGWYGNKHSHSLASRGIKTKINQNIPIRYFGQAYSENDAKMIIDLYKNEGLEAYYQWNEDKIVYEIFVERDLEKEKEMGRRERNFKKQLIKEIRERGKNDPNSLFYEGDFE